MEVVLLSQHPELLEESADLLNKQWKRSASARVQSLEKSISQLPDSLLLIEKNENKAQVIGHSRLTRVLEDPYGCWIGSVVIQEDKRKKGYGKYLMEKTEEYAKVLQFSTAYLNTHDQQGFYEHLGYTYCDPVSSISFLWNGPLPRRILNSSNTDYQNKNNEGKSHDIKTCNINSSNYNSNTLEIISIPPPPPLPPAPQLPNKNSSINNQFKSNLGQYWMKKKL